MEATTENIFIEDEINIQQKNYGRFLNKISEKQKSEYIKGKIVIHSPAKKVHVDVNMNLLGIIRFYVMQYDLGFVGQEKVLIKMNNGDNNYEPDICFFRKDKSTNFDEDTAIFPPPDWAIEIMSKSSVQRDKKIKFIDYARNGIEEYWLIHPKKCTIEQYFLDQNNNYVLIKKYKIRDSITSITLPKLVIPMIAIFSEKDNYDYHFGKFKKELEESKNIILEKTQKLKEKEDIIQQKDQKLKENEEIIQQKDQKLKGKDQKLKENEEIIQQKDQKLKENEEIIQQKDQKLKENEEILQEKDRLITELMQKLSGKQN